MTGTAAISQADPATEHCLRVWRGLCSAVIRSATEFNIMCGQQIWVILAPRDPREPLLIRSRANQCDWAQISLELADGRVVCRFGADARQDALEFGLAAGGALTCGGNPVALDTAVDIILVPLVAGAI